MSNKTTVSCLQNVIGLADAYCICSEEGKPENFSVSLAGRYVADHEFGLPMSKLEELKFRNDETVWDWLAARRTNGTKAFLSDLQLNIPEANRIAFNKYGGFIGDIKEWSYSLQGLKGRTGAGYHPKLYRGVQATIHGVRLWYPGLTSGQVDFHLSTDLLKGITTPHYSLAFSGNVGNIIHVNIPADSPLIIDLEDEYGEPVSIFATVANGGNMPFNTRFFCATCGTPSWGKFFSPQAINIDDNLTQLIPLAQDFTCSYGSANYGLALSLTVECSDNWLCNSMNYTAAWPRIMAEALQMYCHRDAFLEILKMEFMTPASFFGRDETKARVDLINAELAKRMPYLGVNVPISLSDCLICDDRIQVVDNLI